MDNEENSIKKAISAFAALSGVRFNPQSLVEDVVLLSVSFPDAPSFELACANTARALEQLAKGRVAGAELKKELKGWRSYHYQPKVEQGANASCRIVYRNVADGVEVMGFGHRHVPKDVYGRLNSIARRGSFSG